MKILNAENLGDLYTQSLGDSLQVKKERGITLIAMIITIIVLCILAGITINGIIEHQMVKLGVQGTESYVGEMEKEKTLFDRVVELLGGKKQDENPKTEEPESKKYIEDKIIARYDGIQNTKDGHKNDVTVWEDISGNNRNLNMVNTGLSKTVFWEEDGMVNATAGAMYMKTDLIPELQSLKSTTVEMVLYCTEPGGLAGSDAFNMIAVNSAPWVGLGIEMGQEQEISGFIKDSKSDNGTASYKLEKYKKTYIAIVAEEYQNGTGKTRIYINGKEYNSVSRTGENFIIQNENANFMTLFNYYGLYNADNSFVGKIFTTRVYGDALTPEEIQNNYDLDRQRFKIEEKVNTQIAGYAKENLFAQYDGIVNTREGHRSARVWQDISGNNRDMAMYNHGLSDIRYWEQDGMVQTQASSMYFKTNLVPEILNFEEETIEIVMKLGADGTSISRDIFGLISKNEVPWTGIEFEVVTSKRINAFSYEKYTTNLLSYSANENPVYIALAVEKYNGGTGIKRMYVNGEEYVTTPKQGEKFYIQDKNCSYMWIFNGPAWLGDQNSYIGKIYTVRVYDRALSLEEIKKNYNTDKMRYGI